MCTSASRARSQRLIATRLSDVEAKEVSWLWPNYIPCGKLTLLIGDPGVGKSFVSLDLAARVTSGGPWPDGAPGVPPADVVILQAEDDPADTLRPRFDALGGDPARVTLIQAVPVNPNPKIVGT